jgi:hypothetical protein
LGVLSPSSVNGQSNSYERGETVQVPAPIGFSDSKLGVGKPVGGSSFSTTEVVSSDGKITSVVEDAYEAKLRLQRSQFQLNATANALGLASAQWKDASQYRYAHLQVRHISEVRRLETSTPPTRSVDADYFISAVYYGWSLDVMIRGRSNTFTRGVAARLDEVVQGGAQGGAGGSFKQVAQSNELTSEVKLRGLESESGGPTVALSPQEVQQQFRVGEPQPILVEYTFLRETDTKPIEWESRSISPGKYRMERVGFELANQKANGEDWDPLPPSPDPMVQLYRNGEFIATIGGRDNRTSVNFESGRSIAINPNTELSFRVVDEDVTDHDFAGTASARYEQLSQKKPGERIPLSTDDQVQSAWIKLTPIKQFGPEPSTQENRSPAEIKSVYKSPNGVFQIGQPDGWRKQYRADWTGEGQYHVQFMMNPESAEKAQIGGYLSEGIRLNLWMTPDGQRRNVRVQKWAPASIRSLLDANDGFTMVDSSTVRVENTTGIVYTMIGNSAEVSEPEKTQIIYAATPRYTCRISLVSPERTWGRNQPLFEELIKKFQVVGMPN